MNYTCTLNVQIYYRIIFFAFIFSPKVWHRKLRATFFFTILLFICTRGANVQIYFSVIICTSLSDDGAKLRRFEAKLGLQILQVYIFPID